MFDVINTTLSAAVALNGTVTLSYPSGRTAGDYQAIGHKVFSRGLMAELPLNTGYTLTFGASNITFTYKGSTTIPVSTNLMVELNRIGANSDPAATIPLGKPRMAATKLTRLLLGSPAATSSTAIAASQSIAAAASAVLAATTLDVPRNIVAAWTTASVVTVTGKDEYNVTISEASASGTTFTGKKAFKTITSITSSASVTGFTAGFGNVLGLPVYLEGAGSLVAEILDGGIATAGTVVAGVTALATTTTGDVRGTYVPNSAPDGTKKYSLIAAVDDPTFMGVPQA